MADPVAGRRHRVGPVRGDVVRVRSREEILATLGGDGTLRALPFMPEMLGYCGREMVVAARADKTCDTIEWTGNRRMVDTVHLVGARCDGSAHGGCQAGCNLFWRQEWLEWPQSPGQPISPVPAASLSAPPVPLAPPSAPVERAVTEETLARATRADGAYADSGYRCQATELFRASQPMPRHDYVQYLTDIRSRNASVPVVLRGLLIFAVNKYQRLSRRLPGRLRIRDGREYPFDQGTGTGERTPVLPLRPGDLVEVKSKDEIMATLGPDNRNRGMWFDAEMTPYCGRRARVQRLVTRIIDENTGKMIRLGDCVVLEDVVCLGLYHRFCQRAITPYWRSAWLRKIADAPGSERDLPAARPRELT